MQNEHPQQNNAVWEMINKTAENDKRMGQLRNSCNEIAKELARNDAFDCVNDDGAVLSPSECIDGRWVLSNTQWEHWLFSGAAEKYLS